MIGYAAIGRIEQRDDNPSCLRSGIQHVSRGRYHGPGTVRLVLKIRRNICPAIESRGLSDVQLLWARADTKSSKAGSAWV